MITMSMLTEDKERVVLGLEKKGYKNALEIVEVLIKNDNLRKNLQGEIECLKHDVNSLSKQISNLNKEFDFSEIRGEILSKKNDIKNLDTRIKFLENEIYIGLVNLPNIPSDLVPFGLKAEDNEVILTWGDIPVIKNPLPHWDIIKKWDIVDFDLGNKVTGAGFPVYKGKGAKLQRALINYFIDKAVEFGYKEIQTPILVNRESAFATGQLPDKDAQMYHIEGDSLYLIPTAEVTLTNIYRDVLLKEEDLPIKMVGYTPCFRREAGSWGSHVRGLNRLHQFDKVEIVQIVRPDESYNVLENMSEYVQNILKELGLHYRVLKLCGGDISFASALTYDMEVWSVGQQRWLEVSSVSNFETFQSNRLKLRYKKDGDKKSTLLHTLNGSALALPRILAAILENNQTEKGIKIPDVLIPYTGFNYIN